MACCPAVVSGTVALPLIWLLDNVTLQPMLCSVLVPPLEKFSVNDGGGLAGTVLSDPVCRVVPPTLTESSEWPCRPGAAWRCRWSNRWRRHVQRLGHERRRQPLQAGEELPSVDVCWPLMPAFFRAPAISGSV